MAAPRDELLTIPEVLTELRNVSKSTFYRWRQLKKGPKSLTLPNGSVRIKRSELERWKRTLEDAE
ncbi:helix-turn-helix transcriptional regulator [Streptomyces albireticuli]|uniref:Excisionase n=1 Tax=Streptomyces albireticuli TaxID=1940 RepID=A0A2A2D7N3_9ACTN|nr:helix-turn-helix domain-containing protein [Streptomyces albireticuli]MCD9144351.1 helix-turn-helix domain-containing protein [Streptomyces albireticuli]MCD9162006.1 helix-turn-helix domain-containing protein [Streptomyces albireticuli]MCD9193988.1 helix-turn-helix domain-containing protein [Streptomyces albireticuli]PAU47524.1 excisionase [Streptomyces albireticuli]